MCVCVLHPQLLLLLSTAIVVPFVLSVAALDPTLVLGPAMLLVCWSSSSSLRAAVASLVCLHVRCVCHFCGVNMLSCLRSCGSCCVHYSEGVLYPPSISPLSGEYAVCVSAVPCGVCLSCRLATV